MSWYVAVIVRDGPSLSSPQLASLTGSMDAAALFFTSSGPDLTVTFSSDNWVVDDGFEAFVEEAR